MIFKIIAPPLLSSIWFAGAAVAGSGACPTGAMNATQYSDGRHTASGQPFRADGLTAAHRKLAFGTRVRVTNPRTGASVVVIINDRGPFTRGRDIDLARGAAQAIGLRDVGTICAEVLRGQQLEAKAAVPKVIPVAADADLTAQVLSPADEHPGAAPVALTSSRPRPGRTR
jgi:rare lipoprotein A